ncbi:hypothetical protein E4U42_005469 [Claviceps africana]|uniref:Uncharacterized protein n=1 Tax=Claviceps africana TaxID=83212 RepID=A0A8K0NJ36_9HYPO|nr:hypothetical protein E4U42_005469 [Claviceps africana]
MTELVLDSSLSSLAFDIAANGPIIDTATHLGLDTDCSKPLMAPSGDPISPCGKLASCAQPTPSAAHGPAMQSPPFTFPCRVSHLATGHPTGPSPARGDGGIDGEGGDGSSRHIPGGFFHANLSSLSPSATWDFGRASLARSVSADTVMPSYTSSQFHSGLGGRTSLVERSNLDALRQRAERLYRDQQAVIDEMSNEWLKEKAEMLQLIHFLRERLQRLEGENAVLKSMASRNPQGPNLVSPQNSIQSGTLGGLYGSKVASPQESRAHDAGETAGAFSLPPGLDGASRRPHFVRQGGCPFISPSGGPVVGHFGSLGPRTEPQNSASTDFLLASLSSDSVGEVPIIDVQEIDSKLEGIPLKAIAVQRPTFEPPPTAKAVAKNPSTENAHLVHAANDFHQAKRRGLWGAWEREKLRNDRLRSGLGPLTATKDQEQAEHILAADESRRLTMHAGHTPNHSLSLFSTMTAVESSSAAARSQGTTPTAVPSSNPEEQSMDTNGDDDSGERVGVAQHSDDPEDNETGRQLDCVTDAEMEGLLEPSDDVPLKGPLMIKNIPAQDEIFWAQVNQRLDPISRGKDALPKVLQAPELDHMQRSLEGTTSPRQEDAKVPEESSAALESDEEGEDGNAGVEVDVPLIFKATSNFGAPFGLVLS